MHGNSPYYHLALPSNILSARTPPSLQEAAMQRRSNRKLSLDFLHKSKIVERFLGETKPSTAAYIDVREERRQVSTTKSPTRLIYAGSLFLATAGI